jgi:CRP/FNR family cyclic AMP-dependent transcriptional regulator
MTRAAGGRKVANCHMGVDRYPGKAFNRHNSQIVHICGASRSSFAGDPARPHKPCLEGDLTMSMLTNLDLIRRVPLFSMLTNEQAQGIADSVVKRRFRRGELVVEQGRKSNALYILLNGRARVLTSDSRGREVILAVLESGDYVGEMSLIDNEAHSATVRCEIQTDMLILGRADFARCLPENSTLSYAILRGLVRRLRHADRQIESLALLDVYGRVARTLLEMAEDVNGVKMIRGKVSRQDMAKVVGASREMVSRVMKDLEERGVIETQDNGSVVIKERAPQPE